MYNETLHQWITGNEGFREHSGFWNEGLQGIAFADTYAEDTRRKWSWYDAVITVYETMGVDDHPEGDPTTLPMEVAMARNVLRTIQRFTDLAALCASDCYVQLAAAMWTHVLKAIFS